MYGGSPRNQAGVDRRTGPIVPDETLLSTAVFVLTTGDSDLRNLEVFGGIDAQFNRSCGDFFPQRLPITISIENPVREILAGKMDECRSRVDSF
jgi:hypothetical protein